MKKQYITFLLTILMSIVGTRAFAYDANIDGIYYNFSGSGAYVTYLYYYGNNQYAYTGNVVIPESVTYNGKNYSVTSIGTLAFYGCGGLTSITIPSSVTRIEQNAFVGCSGLTSVTIPNSVTYIDNAAFNGCSGLTSIIIGNSVTSIGTAAFYGCRLENVMTKTCKVTFSSSSSSSFSDRTYQHAMLYIPEGTWNEAVYDSDWYHFNNIREVAMGKEGVSSSRAYTLMDTQSFGYAVYDPDDQEVKIVKAFYSFDEKDQNCCWKMVNEGGNQYIYNLGAKKYAQFDANGKITHTSAKVPVAMNEGDNGIKLGADNTREWGFVKNNAISAEETYIPGDANKDKQVNVTDIVAMVNYIMNKPSTDFDFDAADVNEDGEVNVTDIVATVNIIMKGDN